jgi:hypothetical protein
VPNFGYSEVLFKMTDVIPLLLAPKDKSLTLNIFNRKFSVDFPTREDWSTKCVDLVAPNGLVFFTDGSFCEGRAGGCVFSDVLNVRESYAMGSHAIRSFSPKNILFCRVGSIAFRRALSTEQYQSALMVNGWIVSRGVALLHAGHKTDRMCSTVYL